MRRFQPSLKLNAALGALARLRFSGNRNGVESSVNRLGLTSCVKRDRSQTEETLR
ncbi:unnamed protein product, partial [Callosobruchus maculatus]